MTCLHILHWKILRPLRRLGNFTEFIDAMEKSQWNFYFFPIYTMFPAFFRRIGPTCAAFSGGRRRLGVK